MMTREQIDLSRGLTEGVPPVEFETTTRASSSNKPVRTQKGYTAMEKQKWKN